jgi:hypothetical protein
MESLKDLRLELARFVGELLKDHAEFIWANQDWQVDITDASGLILYVVHISALETPATAGSAMSDCVTSGGLQRVEGLRLVRRSRHILCWRPR